MKPAGEWKYADNCKLFHNYIANHDILNFSNNQILHFHELADEIIHCDFCGKSFTKKSNITKIWERRHDS